MASAEKLPLLKRSMGLLVDQLGGDDRISMVVYAGASGVALPPTPGSERAKILGALERLEAGGSTNGGAGIQLAYDLAQRAFIKGGINRVILATDGDFNVGTTSHGDLTRLIEEKRESGVYLTVLGFGRGNLKDSTMETLADKGNGNYAYIDALNEARKVLVREMGATLNTIAKDVKVQVELNPEFVERYRLIGYENRVLAARDFNDDTKDAGELGAGHSVTVLYEIVPVSTTRPSGSAEVDPLKYQQDRQPTPASSSNELLTVKLRYKPPSSNTSTLLSRTLTAEALAFDAASQSFKFAAAVAGFGMLLRDSEHKGNATIASVRTMAQSALGEDPHGDRRELVSLMARAASLM
jgi:Ca-activated chloride channel family protein